MLTTWKIYRVARNFNRKGRIWIIKFIIKWNKYIRLIIRGYKY